MKRILAILLALALLIPAAFAEEYVTSYAPENAGIAVNLSSDWMFLLMMDLYGRTDRATSDPCEYSDVFFLTDNELLATDHPFLVLALSNRMVGSDHVPVTEDVPAPTEHIVLLTQDDRELVMWYNDLAEFSSDANTFVLPAINRLIAYPEDVTISQPMPRPVGVGYDGLYGVNVMDLSPVTTDAYVGKKLTMLNIWATYCNPCINEMPDLAKLNADYADQGFQIIGLLTDVGNADRYDEEALEYGQDIVNTTGADYLHVLPGEGMFYGALNDITSVPTTIFVDENGQQVGEIYVGSRSYEAWEAIIVDLLSGIQ